MSGDDKNTDAIRDLNISMSNTKIGLHIYPKNADTKNIKFNNYSIIELAIIKIE
jgi:serine protease inhibitor